jgi:hypothetical protein
MSTISEIEAAVSQLTREELSAFRMWFQDFDADAWDRQMEEDARSGRLDSFYQSLERENEGQPDVPLDEVLNKEKLS